MVRIEGIEHRIAAEPFLPGDAAIAIEIIEQEDLLGGVGEGRSTFQLTEAMGQLGFEGFNRLDETANPLIKLVGGHGIGDHHRVEAGAVQVELGPGGGRGRPIELAGQVRFAAAQLIQQFR